MVPTGVANKDWCLEEGMKLGLGRGSERWCTPLIPSLRRQRQVDLSETEDSLVYRANSRAARDTQRDTVLKNQK